MPEKAASLVSRQTKSQNANFTDFSERHRSHPKLTAVVEFSQIIHFSYILMHDSLLNRLLELRTIRGAWHRDCNAPFQMAVTIPRPIGF
jgi:hypothetical protein